MKQLRDVLLGPVVNLEADGLSLMALEDFLNSGSGSGFSRAKFTKPGANMPVLSEKQPAMWPGLGWASPGHSLFVAGRPRKVSQDQTSSWHRIRAEVASWTR